MTDMKKEDFFGDTKFGRIALQKIAHPDPNFYLYECGWLGENNEREVMECKGAVFRRALAGRNKGKLCIIVPGTERTTWVTAGEMK